MEPLPRGVFALPSPYLDLEVSVAGLALEVEGLALGAVGALPLAEVAFFALPSPLSAALPLHTLGHIAAARALLSASWAPTTEGGGLSSCSWASPIGFQANLVLDRYLSRAL